MKLKDYNNPDYLGSYKVVDTVGSNKLAILNFKSFEESGIKRENGRANLVCLDSQENNIIWVAETPIEARTIGEYTSAKLDENRKIIAWYAFNLIRVEINPQTGKILREQVIY